MPVAVGETVRVTVKMDDVNGSSIQNVYFYLNDGIATADNDDVLTAVEAAMSLNYTAIEGIMPDTLTPVEIDIDRVAFVGGELIVTGKVGTIPWTNWSGGTSTSDGLPQGNAAVINFPVSGPTVQGRKYIGPLTENQQSNGILTAPALATLVSFGAALLGDILVDDNQFRSGIMSTKSGAFAELASTIVKAVIGYQRRRKSGVGI